MAHCGSPSGLSVSRRICRRRCFHSTFQKDYSPPMNRIVVLTPYSHVPPAMPNLCLPVLARIYSSSHHRVRSLSSRRFQSLDESTSRCSCSSPSVSHEQLQGQPGVVQEEHTPAGQIMRAHPRLPRHSIPTACRRGRASGAGRRHHRGYARCRGGATMYAG